MLADDKIKVSSFIHSKMENIKQFTAINKIYMKIFHYIIGLGI